MNGPVVVPLDGSTFDEVAVAMGRTLAERTGVGLHLIHVLAVPLPGAFHPEDQLTLDEHVRSRSRRYLDGVAGSEPAVAGRPPVTAQLDGTRGVHGAIAEYASRVGASWAVLTTHGVGGVSRWLTGSVADALSKISATPLLLLRPWNTTGDAAVEPRFRRILVPLDGSPESDAALPPAAQLARSFGATLSLVRVIPPRASSRILRGAPLMGGSTAIEAEADRYLEDRVEELRHQGVAADSSPVAFLDPAEGILSAVVERGADAIVMSTRSRAGFERVVLGSVAHEVLRKARVPLVLVHPMSERPGVHGGVTAGAARAQT